jgi:hypothetical protein
MMRDLVWTVIAIWLIYRIVSIFRHSSPGPQVNKGPKKEDSAPPKNGKSRLDTEGEYVDYEEIR